MKYHIIISVSSKSPSHFFYEEPGRGAIAADDRAGEGMIFGGSDRSQ
jgi:hypothetical protein